MNDFYFETGILDAVLSVTVFALKATLVVVAFGTGLAVFGVL
ncbi:hypothetical protein [Maribacter algarum]|nr:hypothetical protein [Maribacter algarum]